MERKVMAYWGVGFVVLVVVLMIGFGGDDSAVDEVQAPENTASVSTPTPTPTPSAPRAINYQTYNYDFVDENVKGILTRMIGANGKTAFYLPSSGYINVSLGSEYGVAYAMQNAISEDRIQIEYDWTVDDSVAQSCGVSVDEAQKWIERGSRSWGGLPKGWIDHMTVYFSFPSEIEPCAVKYNFVMTADGSAYSSKTLTFNLI